MLKQAYGVLEDKNQMDNELLSKAFEGASFRSVQILFLSVSNSTYSRMST